MKTRLSPEQIGKRILDLRKTKGFSQQEIAQFLEIPRSAVAQIELGNRNVSIAELIKLSEVLQFSIDDFVGQTFGAGKSKIAAEPKAEKQQGRISVPKLQIPKFKNVLLFMLEKCAGKPNVGETVLYKLLYFSDFNYYEIYEEHLTGAEYRKLPFGPVPHKPDHILQQMIEKGTVKRIKTEYHGYPQTRYLPLEKADLTQLTGAEKEVIDKVVEQMSDWTARMISDYSHNDKPWKATEENSTIDYELVFYRNPPYSVRIYDEDERDTI